MLLHKDPNFNIYFGDAQDELMPPFYLNLPSDIRLLEISPFSRLKQDMGLKNLIFLHQIHSIQGVIVNKETIGAIKPFKDEGDFLITRLSTVGLGIMSADCLPIIFYDQELKIIAAIHAGWKGSVQGVAVKALEKMYEAFGVQPKNLAVFFGPSACANCYKVGIEFKDHLAGFAHIDDVLLQRNGGFYFDVPQFNQIQLEAAGVKRDSIHRQYNLCTMCKLAFYSHRRDGEKAGRQMTVISLVF